MSSLVLPAIAMVKAGAAAQGGTLVQQAVQKLRAQGASAVVLACTETPVALDAIQAPERAYCIDSTAALAGRCVSWWRNERPLPSSLVV
jgi:aspartate racemase